MVRLPTATPGGQLLEERGGPHGRCGRERCQCSERGGPWSSSHFRSSVTPYPTPPHGGIPVAGFCLRGRPMEDRPRAVRTQVGEAAKRRAVMALGVNSGERNGFGASNGVEGLEPGGESVVGSPVWRSGAWARTVQNGRVAPTANPVPYPVGVCCLWVFELPVGRRAKGSAAVNGEARRRGWARLTAVCALLLGLFLMHGAPSSAVGCHSSAAVMPVSMPAPASNDHGTAAVAKGTQPLTSSPATGSYGSVEHGASVTMAGALCVSTEADRGVALSAGLLLGALFGGGYMPVAVAWVRAEGRNRRRGPPPGRELLLRGCVART